MSTAEKPGDKHSRFAVLNEVHQRLHDMKNLQRASAWPHVEGVARAEKMVWDLIVACQPEDSVAPVSSTVPIRACLQWCVDHDGECLGDHQSILASCIEALKNAPSLQEQADDELRMRLDHPTLSMACPICGHDQPHEHHWPWALSSVETPVSATPRSDGMPLLFNVFNMICQDRDEDWKEQWRELMKEIELVLTRAGYTMPKAGGDYAVAAPIRPTDDGAKEKA